MLGYFLYVVQRHALYVEHLKSQSFFFVKEIQLVGEWKAFFHNKKQSQSSHRVCDLGEALTRMISYFIFSREYVAIQDK